MGGITGPVALAAASSGARERRYTWLGILLGGVLVAFCYGYALQLPFFFDDLPVLAWLGGHDLADVWTTSSENAYYRPLTFTLYKLAQLLPKGAQQVALHGANLALHWLNAVLVMQLVRLFYRGHEGHVRGLLALALFALFPFMFRAIPWVTALPHPLVVTLTLVAAYAALRAERDDAAGWWGLSLAATALAPFAHESGLVCGLMVCGLIGIQYGFRARPRAIAGAAAGVLLNAGAVLLRSRIPGAGGFLPDGLNSAFENVMFFLHGLVYPVGPVMGTLVHQHGWHDFTLIQGATLCLTLVLAWLGIRGRDGRWIARGLWWWACGALAAGIRFRYGGLVNSPRFYALSSVGIVMLWADVIVRLGASVRPAWGRRLTWGALAGGILVSNLWFLYAQQQVMLSLSHVYQEILQVAEDPRNAPLGFVNVPAWLTPQKQAYPLTKDGAVMLPLYTNVREFIGINRQARAADNVMYAGLLQEPEDIYWGFHGDWLDAEQVRQFAIDHRTVWLARYEGGRFVLRQVGAISEQAQPVSGQPVARFDGGPLLEAAAVQKDGAGGWTLTLTWLATGPAQGNVFVHVVDAQGSLVVQADGAALGGMVPLWVWRSGDRVYDVRHIVLPGGGSPQDGPYTILVGVYDQDARFPAFAGGVRCPNDAVPVATLGL
jgi:hypothetical protein